MPRGRPRKHPLPLEKIADTSATMKAKQPAAQAAMTSAQRLGSLIKSARDILRKDKGLSGDADRLPQLTWIMFLKFLDDLEKVRADEATLAGSKYKPIIEAPYRWRDWASSADGVTGDALIAFINQEEVSRPDGKKGPGLFSYLRKLSGSGDGRDSRDVVATVFKGVVNRQINGYLLRDILVKIDGIHFFSTEEIHTLSHLYELMLREMRDAAGAAGEFYTPRPLIRFCVEVIAPRLGEKVLDPACGSAGFLVESFKFLQSQVKTPRDRKVLQSSHFGVEAKPLPYLLAQMNLLLHGVEAPDIDPENALRFKINEIGDKDRFDVILSNPPFGGEEEKGIENNFPADKQTAETALLFLQLIMRRLRRHSANDSVPRAAVIVPEGTLFNDGVSARIRRQLLEEFNVHTIIRLPDGIFAPYANSIKTNILFFDRSGPTKEIWFYELHVPDGRKSYSKTKPVHYDDFLPCLEWWANKKENANAWNVKIDDVIERQYSLDFKNPNGFESLSHLAPAIIATRALDGLRSLDSKLSRIRDGIALLKKLDGKPASIGSFATHIKREWNPEVGQLEVRSLGVKWWGKGAYVSETKSPDELQADRFLVRSGDLIYNDMWARHGSVAVVPEDLDQCVASAHFPTFELNREVVDIEYLSLIFKCPWFWQMCEERSRGSTGRNAIRKKLFLSISIPLPLLDRQRQIARDLKEVLADVTSLNDGLDALKTEFDALSPSMLDFSLSPFNDTDAAK